MKPNLALNELVNHFVNEVLGKFNFNYFKNIKGRLAQVDMLQKHCLILVNVLLELYLPILEVRLLK